MIGTQIEIRRKGDWLLYFLLLAAALCLPFGVSASGWVPDGGRLIYVTLVASLVASLVARSPLPEGLSWFLGVILGVEYAVQFAGGVLPSVGVFLDDGLHALGWLWNLAFWHILDPVWPFSATVTLAFSQGQVMFVHLSAWLATVQKGAPSSDNTALFLGASFVIWILTWNAAYELFRRRRTFAALIPLGIAVVTNVSFTDIGMVYVQVFLGATLLTLVWASMGQMERVWARLGLDFSPELRRDAAITGFSLSTLVLVVALLIPYTTYNDAIWFFWDRYGPRFESFYKKLDSAFAGRNPVPSPTPSKRGLSPHAIRGGTDLTDKMVFMVTTSDPVPLREEELIRIGRAADDYYVTKHYWRERTYDQYTGHGWDSSERQATLLNKDAIWGEVIYPSTLLTQTFYLRATSDLAYAVNEPVKVDHEYRAFTRGPGDLAGFAVGTISYTVVSQVPDATIEELQQAEAAYPDWVLQRFLKLPSIPEDVRQKAAEVVQQAGAVTRYDKAKAIEAYLRSFTYDAKLEPPPLDADVVEYFLFTAKRGYCDYSATAMVVMLRSLGVAARYASGYGMGTYNYEQGAWVVSENNSHAWAEVYFPGHGWLEFEPTPVQPLFVRNVSRNQSPLPTLPAAVLQPKRTLPPLWLASGGLLLVLLFVIIWPPRWFRRARRAPQQTVRQVYLQLASRARWLGLGPLDGQTPREYLRGLAGVLAEWASFDPGSVRDVELIERAYERARYSVEAINEEDGQRVEGAWRRLRSTLLRLLFVRKPPSAPAPAVRP
jgi:transglutaminase-like putative cysteine protease